MPVTKGGSGIAAGTVAHFAANTAPAGWLKANGATVSRTTYAALFLAIGTTYGAGDGSTTFALPDLRGEFLRGFDDGRGVDSGRGIGTAQGQQIESHDHPYEDVRNASVGVFSYTGGTGMDKGFIANRNTSPTGGTETRPRNVALLACIKF